MSFRQKASRWLLGMLGWTLGYEDPLTRRYVLIVAPHTSNWDFPLGLLAAWALDLRAHWIGKHTLFKGPLAPLMRAWGGIPVERSEASDVITQMANRFAESEEFVLAIAPEGTRSHRPHWKSGFWHIARAAEVPIAMAYLDYGKKEIGMGGTFMPGDDRDADFERIRAYYEGRLGKYPEKAGGVRGRQDA